MDQLVQTASGEQEKNRKNETTALDCRDSLSLMLDAMNGSRRMRDIPVLPKIWIDSAAELKNIPMRELIEDPIAAMSIIPEVSRELHANAARLFLFPRRKVEQRDGKLVEISSDGKSMGEVDLTGGLSVHPRNAETLDWEDPETLFRLQWAPATIGDEYKFRFEDVAVPDKSFYSALGYDKAVKQTLKRYSPNLCCVGDCDTPSLAFMARFRGVQQTLMDLIERPELVKACFALGVEFCVQRAKFFIDAGCKVLRLNDSMANMFLISPAQWQEFVFPAFREVCSRVHGYDNEVRIYCHICGNVEPVIEQLAMTGLGCIGPIDPMGMNAGNARKKLGWDFCLMAGVNTMTLANGTPQQVRDEAIALMASAGSQRKGFILSTGCAVPRKTTRENLLALAEAAAEFSADW